MSNKIEISENKKKAFYLLWIVGCLAIIVICFSIISKLMEPKVDYESLYRDINAYTSQLENIVDVEDAEHGSFKITLESNSWYTGSERDKMAYCKHVNENFTYLCQKYNLIKDTSWAKIYYYDENGINIAEPSDKGYDLESNILH